VTAARTSSAGSKTGLAEEVVQNYIDQICGYANVAHYHTKMSKGSMGRGFLDSVCIGPGGALVFEAKDDDGKKTAEQELWTWLWESIGVRVVLVRPADMVPRADLGNKSLIQFEIARIATGDGGKKFPPHIIAGLKLARNTAARDLAKDIARSRARRK
jgi:hypothetical protein